MKKILLIAILLFILVLTILLITNNITKKQALKIDKIKITASFYPLAEFAKQVGGENVKVVNITPSGYEPHDYEPTPQNIVDINQSKIFIYNGSNLDPWAQKIAPELNKKGVVTIRMTDYFNLLTYKNNKPSPHIWLDPVLIKKEVEIISDALQKIDPRNSSTYKKNTKLYIEKLEKLNQEFKDGLSSCKLREAIASHDAFGYLSKRYNIDIIPISGISPKEEPSLRKLSEITKLAKNKKIKYIFFETLANPKLSKMIAQEVGAKTLVLNPIEGLTEKEIKSGENYISEMRKNLNNLKLALACK